jgi:hypothetical protein
VRRKFYLLVTPFRRPVLARDDSRAVDAAEVSVNECVAALRLVTGSVVEAEMPLGVLVP